MNIAVVDDLAVGRETLVNYLNEYFSERNMNVTISEYIRIFRCRKFCHAI